MIHPRAGVAFSLAAQGDQRQNLAARTVVSDLLGISPDWATVHQVHGRRVVQVDGAGDFGEADAIFTRQAGLPIAVFTADCAGVVIGASEAVGVAHAGWRGAAGGVVPALLAAMERAGVVPRWAAIGPTIGSCCFEVGPEVAARFPGNVGSTSWGSTSVDLAGALVGQLGNLELWQAGVCTLHDEGSFSHRRNSAVDRMAAVAWVPE